MPDYSCHGLSRGRPTSIQGYLVEYPNFLTKKFIYIGYIQVCILKNKKKHSETVFYTANRPKMTCPYSFFSHTRRPNEDQRPANPYSPLPHPYGLFDSQWRAAAPSPRTADSGASGWGVGRRAEGGSRQPAAGSTQQRGASPRLRLRQSDC